VSKNINRYCGLDPSLLGCTISKFDNKKILDFLFIRVDNGNILDRIFLINNLVKIFLLENKIKSLIIETPYYNRFNPKTYGEQLRLYQQLINLCIELNISFSEKNANSIKKFVIKGQAKKEKMIEFFMENIILSDQLLYKDLNKKEQEGIIDSLYIGMSNNEIEEFLIDK
jgi:hypothetical protein